MRGRLEERVLTAAAAECDKKADLKGGEEVGGKGSGSSIPEGQEGTHTLREGGLAAALEKDKKAHLRKGKGGGRGGGRGVGKRVWQQHSRRPRGYTHLEGRGLGSSVREGQEGMAGLFRQLHHLCMRPISYIAHQGNALL